MFVGKNTLKFENKHLRKHIHLQSLSSCNVNKKNTQYEVKELFSNESRC